MRSRDNTRRRFVSRKKAEDVEPAPPSALFPESETDSLWYFEHCAQAEGYRYIAGSDEAGRGPLAGPIVAAAIILTEPVEGVCDSKQLTARRREALFNQLTCGKHPYALCVISNDTIDAVGIQQANVKALSTALLQLQPRPDFALVDGFDLQPWVPFPTRRIIRGDARSASIAAASILAKVTRDRYMEEADRAFPQYGFARHKGYGTPEHVQALQRYGPCPLHRRSFAPVAAISCAASKSDVPNNIL